MKSARAFFSVSNPVSALLLFAVTAIVSLLMFSCPAPDNGGTTTTQAATPAIAPAPGTIEQDTATVVITCVTAGAVIHYTDDNTAPTAASPLIYNPATPLAVSAYPEGALHIKALAVLSGSTDSAVASADYTVVDTLGPVAVITSAYPSGINGPFNVTVTFNEPVAGFTAACVNVANADPIVLADISGAGPAYTVHVTPNAADGTDVTVQIPAAADSGALVDTASTPNTNIASNLFSILYDSRMPIGTITSTAADPANASPIPVRIDFGAINVTGFDITDLTVGNGAASNFAGSSPVFTADITPSGQGTVTVDILANVCTSQGTGAANLASPQFTIGYDSVAPNLVGVTPASGGYATSSPVLITVDWSEPVTGFTSGDIADLVNGAVSNWTAVSGAQYTFDLTPSSQASFSFDIAAGACADPAGNASTGSAAWSKTYHSTIPTIASVSPASGGYATYLPIPMTIDWNENVTGFTVSDIGGLTNCSISNFTTVSGTAYTFDLTPSDQGAFGFTVPAGACQNIAATPSTGPVSWSRTFDNTTPTVSSVMPASGGFTATSPVNVEVDWSEAVSGFTAGDITNLVNCSVTNFTQAAPDHYTFDVTPASEAAFSFDIAAGVCADTAGNPSTGDTAWSMTYSSSLPYVTAVAPADGGYATASPVPITIDWNTTVTGFTVSDIGTLVNGSVSNWTAVSGSRYTFNLTPSAQGAFGFTIPAGACADLASNLSAGPVAWSRTFDTVAPTVFSVTPAAGGYTAASPLAVTVDWSESVAGFNVADLSSLDNCSVSNFTAVSATRYTFDLTPGSPTAFGFRINPSACADAAGNPSDGTTVWSKTYHTTIPAVTGISPASGGYETFSPIPLTITWNENVTGFDTSDIGSLINCSVGNWTALSGSQYSFELTPAGQGAFGFTVAASVCQDVAANPSIGPVSWSRTYDSVAPSVSSVTPATGGYATSTPTTVDVFWNESVSGFTSGDITSLTNCALSNWSAVSGSHYSFDLTPGSQAAFGFQIGSGVCADAAGNASSGAVAWSKTFDNVAPSVSSVAPATGGYTTAAATPVQIDWSEDVTGFAASDIGTLVNCAVSAFTPVSGSRYTFTLTPAAEGAFGFQIAASACVDTAGNASAGPVNWGGTYDATPPVINTIIPSNGNYTAVNPITVEIIWHENVSGFDSSDIANLANCSLSGWSQVSPSVYTFQLTAASQAAFGFRIDPSACADAAGNLFADTIIWSNTYISSPPSVSSITPASGGYATYSPLTIEVDWSHAVTGFSAADIGNLQNCAVSNWTAVSGTNYTFTLTPTTQDYFSFQIDAGACQDGAGNPSAGPVDWSRTLDTIAPAVSSVWPVSGGYFGASPLTVTVEWSESVAGFTEGDIGSLVNCTISNFTAISGSQYTFDMTPLSQALCGFQISASACADLAGNPSSGSLAWNGTYDPNRPNAVITPVAGGYANSSPVAMTVTWDKTVTGFDSSDIGALVNCVVSGWTAVSPTVYTFNLSPTTQDALFGFTIASGACQDLASNMSAGPYEWSRTFDSIAPSVTINQAVDQGDPTNVSPINFTVVFSEATTDFATGDVTISGTAGGTKTATVTGSGTAYNVAVTGMTSKGTVVADIAAGAAHDPEGNANTASTSADKSVTWFNSVAIGNWTAATAGSFTVVKQAGTNRVLLLFIEAYRSSSTSGKVTSVSYGGQALIKLSERTYDTTSPTVTNSVWYLKEAGVAAAGTTALAITWNGGPAQQRNYAVFLQNVNQTASYANIQGGDATTTVAGSAAVNNSAGDMGFIAVSAMTTDEGTSTINTAGFTVDQDENTTSDFDAVVGHKALNATGSFTPNFTQSAGNKQTLQGFVIQGY
jgi:hypothetical protein